MGEKDNPPSELGVWPHPHSGSVIPGSHGEVLGSAWGGSETTEEGMGRPEGEW